ncbi:MAG TPA: DUF4956 domain-containing protein [Kofleriaceae bacterium]|nr:DUF4956 domain-containing protein [Kofleriaceae bacterium]
MHEIFGLEAIVNPSELMQLGTRLAIDLLFAWVVIRVVYFRLYPNREYVFTYYMFNVITFSLCSLLTKVPIELGFALGLFAVFGILRYRTEAVRIRDQTYLFIVIGLGILNAVANGRISLAELLAVNAVIAGLTAMLELSPHSRNVQSTLMFYDNLDFLKPGCEAELFCDLITRTGLRVVRVNVKRVDMLRDAAEIEVFYAADREVA